MAKTFQDLLNEGQAKVLGIVSIVPMDDWNTDTQYQKLNLVRHNGAAYLAKGGSKNVEPGVTQDWQNSWMLVYLDGILSPDGTYPNLTAGRVMHALAWGNKNYDGSSAQTITAADLGLADVYKLQGSIAFASLPATPNESNYGYVWNITNDFTTDSRFIEGAGKEYSAGTNVGVIEQDGQYYYDILGNFVDLSNYAQIDGNYQKMTVGQATNAQNAANVTAQIDGHAISDIFETDGTTVKEAAQAQRASADEDGNNIVATYAKKNGSYATLGAGKLALSAAVGSSLTPVYFSADGVPVACDKELAGEQTAGGGFQGGNNARAEANGGAIGAKARATDGGFAGGLNTFASTGAAVGEGANATSGGAVGDGTVSEGGGGAVGDSAEETAGGFAGGYGASATSGGAVGYAATATTGFAGGYGAASNADGAVQLGQGENNTENTLQFRSYQLCDASGNIPAERLSANSPVRSVNGKTGAVSLSAADVGAATETQVNSVSMVPYGGQATTLSALASGGVYSISANGYLRVAYQTTAADNYITMKQVNSSGADMWGALSNGQKSYGSGYPYIYMPVAAGDHIKVEFGSSVKIIQVQLIKVKGV